MASISRTLERIKQDLRAFLPDESVLGACRRAGHEWRERKLDPPGDGPPRGHGAGVRGELCRLQPSGAGGADGGAGGGVVGQSERVGRSADAGAGAEGAGGRVPRMRGLGTDGRDGAVWVNSWLG